MSNPLTGETVLRSRDGGHEYRIVFTEQAVMEAETVLNTGAIDLVRRGLAGTWKLAELQVLVWAGMNGYLHRTQSTKKQVTLEKAMSIIKACGGMALVMGEVAGALCGCDVLGLTIPVDDDDARGSTDDGDGDEVDPTRGDADGTEPQ